MSVLLLPLLATLDFSARFGSILVNPIEQLPIVSYRTVFTVSVLPPLYLSTAPLANSVRFNSIRSDPIGHLNEFPLFLLFSPLFSWAQWQLAPLRGHGLRGCSGVLKVSRVFSTALLGPFSLGYSYVASEVLTLFGSQREATGRGYW